MDVLLQSLLDTDLYKLTMMQVVQRRYPTVPVEYQFNCRSQGVDLRPIRQELELGVERLGELMVSPEELDFLRGLGLFRDDFLLFLQRFRLDPQQVKIDEVQGRLDLRVEGSWLETILFEVPVLALISELHSRVASPPPPLEEGPRRLEVKVELLRRAGGLDGFQLVEFGTRRRYSGKWQRQVVETLARELGATFGGTSNVSLAKALGLRTVGTMAHEYLQAFQALVPDLRTFQRRALEVWLAEYPDEVGIALSDVVGIDAFLRDLGGSLARRYRGLRHDSGDPFSWVDKVLGHYERLGIDSAEKVLVFSDRLDIPRCLDLHRYVAGRARTTFGIGTHLVNDVGQRPLEMVIKLVRCNGRPVAKVPDSAGKIVCEDPDFLRRLIDVFELSPAFVPG